MSLQLEKIFDIQSLEVVQEIHGALAVVRQLTFVLPVCKGDHGIVSINIVHPSWHELLPTCDPSPALPLIPTTSNRHITATHPLATPPRISPRSVSPHP